jgi:hypothetical protein
MKFGLFLGNSAREATLKPFDSQGSVRGALILTRKAAVPN